jgi:hypothetical protein
MTDKDYKLRERILGVNVILLRFRDVISLGFNIFVKKVLNFSINMRNPNYKI